MTERLEPTYLLNGVPATFEPRLAALVSEGTLLLADYHELLTDVQEINRKNPGDPPVGDLTLDEIADETSIIGTANLERRRLKEFEKVIEADKRADRLAERSRLWSSSVTALVQAMFAQAARPLAELQIAMWVGGVRRTDEVSQEINDISHKLAKLSGWKASLDLYPHSQDKSKSPGRLAPIVRWIRSTTGQLILLVVAGVLATLGAAWLAPQLGIHL